VLRCHLCKVPRVKSRSEAILRRFSANFVPRPSICAAAVPSAVTLTSTRLFDKTSVKWSMRINGSLLNRIVSFVNFQSVRVDVYVCVKCHVCKE